MKKLYKFFFLILLLLIISLSSFSQSVSTSKSVNIGDPVPDITINNIINYKTINRRSANTAKISDFKRKLLILDFWATWCSSCIMEFPKLYDLQKQFKDQMQILLVDTKDTRDDKIKVENFFNKRKDIYQFPCVIYDTKLNMLFPHKSIPHTVWIMNSKVVAITSSEEVNQANIKAVLTSGKIDLYTKSDLNYNFLKPLFIDGNGGTPPGYIFRSLLTGYVRGLKSSMGVVYQKDKIATRIYQTNTSLLHLFQQAYPEYRKFKRNQIIFDVGHPTDFSLDSNSVSWNSKHLYNYELTFPPQNVDSALYLLRDDLARYFNFSVHIEIQNAPCLVLKKIGNPIPATSGVTETNIYEKDDSPKYLKNYPFTTLVYQLNNLYKVPIIDETGFTGNINLNLPADLTNELLLRDSLKKQGFLLDSEKRKLSFLVFSEPKTAK